MNNNGPENLREQNPTMPQFFEDCKQVKLSEICTKGNSSLRQKDVFNNGPYRVYGASGIVGTMDKYQNEVPYVAVVKDGAGVGRANRCDPMTSVLGTMQALIPNPNVERDYLLHLIRSLRLGDGFSGSTIPHIYFKDYGKIEVPLPSIDTQKRIVSRLGSVEAQIAQAEAQIEQLDSLVKSRFIEMFGDPIENNSKLPKYKWEDVLTIVNGKNQKKVECATGEYPICGSGGEMGRAKQYLTKGDSVIIGRKGNINNPILMREPFWNVDTAFGLEPNADMLIVEYLYYYCEWFDFQKLNKAVTIPSLTKADLLKIEMPLPPLALQQEFADFVSQVDKLRFETQQQIEKLETLKKSLMQEYFG